jgi:hypothetical protein
VKKKPNIDRDLELITERTLMVVNDFISRDAEINTQQKFSQAIGLAQNRFTRFKQGIAHPSTKEILMICEFCNVSPMMILQGKKDGHLSMSERVKLIEMHVVALRKQML